MSYEIDSINDFLTGVSLIVKIPEDELDRKALLTIQEDKPEFILPFHYKTIDGQVEFVYQVGTHSKLQYLSGERLTKEYIELWLGVFSPLLDCSDWFMNPYSFMLNAEYLYYDKYKKVVSYVYIPSTKGCSGYAALKEMAAEVTRFISVANTDLENKVLRAIMKDFKPDDFLNMLKSYMSANVHAAQTHAQPVWELNAHTPAFAGETLTAPLPAQQTGLKGENKIITPHPASVLVNNECHQSSAIKPGESQLQERAPSTPGEIVINIPTKGMNDKSKQGKEKNKEAYNSGRKEKKDKKQKESGGLFGKKKTMRQEVDCVAVSIPKPELQEIPVTLPVDTQLADLGGAAQSASNEAGGARFCLCGSTRLPKIIDVKIGIGELFTIGRFDAAIGKQQSSFEFDKKTKAVSRRHAVIERQKNGYNIIDLVSSAGTFMNGRKLPPNMPCELGYGCHISFGNAGADYVWEEN